MSLTFKVNDYCVYRTHGVAKIKEIKDIKIGEMENKCLVLFFEKEKLTLVVPAKFKENGDIRKLSSLEDMDKVFDILKCGVKKLKGMWSRRAKEYRDKINSGDIFQIADVLKDLIRDVDEADRSYSERSIYDLAIYRLASEYAVVKKISYKEAEDYITDIAKERVGTNTSNTKEA
ncbi:MAG: CarD family transcriptional regulator [Rickettsiales bacterium]|nr:CarD family transcriptional regulator [Rickettsiales bacterium]